MCIKQVYDELDNIFHIPLKWQQINKNAIHPSTDQGRMQKVGIRPNYTQGGVIADACSEKYSPVNIS